MYGFLYAYLLQFTCRLKAMIKKEVRKSDGKENFPSFLTDSYNGKLTRVGYIRVQT